MSAPAQASPGAARSPADRSPLAWFAYGLALVVVIADQLSKYWIVHGLRLQEGMSVRLLPVFSLTGVQNRGVSYGLFTAHGDLGRWALVLFSLGVAVGLAVWARQAVRPIAAGAIGLIMGGAIGNAIDRARLGSVVDFLDFSGLHFPWVFNLADSAISVGVVLLVLDSYTSPKPG